jgi:alpha-L-rhamnosidase
MHVFKGKWITDSEFFSLRPRNVFHRQLEPLHISCVEHRNRHILFRRKFYLKELPGKAKIYITADDYYKLYINGKPIGQGPAPGYPSHYPYNILDITSFLQRGENVIAVHTLYQGLINRVWVSGDLRHGLLCDVEADGEIILYTDTSWRTQRHSGYQESGVVGIQTQFMESYDSNAPEIGFEQPEYDDRNWEYSRYCLNDDHVLEEQTVSPLVLETVYPKTVCRNRQSMLVDFGAVFAGYLSASATGKKGEVITVRCGDELNKDGSLRYQMRCNCTYEESWILKEGESRLQWFDYKAFRYAEFIMPEGVSIDENTIDLMVRHAPFSLKTSMKKEYAKIPDMVAIWNLCVRTMQFGVQEVIQDCLDRERGFYLGDGCYTALTYLILTGNEAMIRKLIDDAFSSAFISDGLVTCLDCSFMQEIAEFPLILTDLVYWYYNYGGDRQYLEVNYKKTVHLLESYRNQYEEEGILRDLDKWCVVEWPKNFQHGYDVDIEEGKICHEAHVAINAYYLHAVQTANAMARELGVAPYREESDLFQVFWNTFYDESRHRFRDGEYTDHCSIVGNVFPFAFDLCPDELSRNGIRDDIQKAGIHSFSLFCTFPILSALVRHGEDELLEEFLLDSDAWLRMIREGATATFEGWGKDSKKNISMFHLTLAYAAAFIADIDLKKIFTGQNSDGNP